MKSFFKFLLFVLVLSVALAGLYRMRDQSNTKHSEVSVAVAPQGLAKASTPLTQATEPPIKASEVNLLAALDQQYTMLIERVVPSVVSINTARTVQVPAYYFDPFERLFGGGSGYRVRPQQRKQTSLGSGVIVTKEGHVITNNHVIDGMDEIEVVLSDGRTLPATLLDTEPNIDIAVLKIEADNLSPLPFGNSDDVRVGQLVFAIGNPFGLEESVSHGIISAIGRRTMADAATEFFQTTAALNPGNSGGPLVNLRGEIIGINNQIFSQTGGWQGIGLAIPSNAARRALESVATYGRITSGYLGVAIQPMDEKLAKQFGLQDGKGALVREVTPNSPAEQAGIRHGDVIVKFNGKPVNDFITLRNRVVEAGINTEAEVVVIRNGKPLTLKTIVAEAPTEANALLGQSPPTQASPPQQPQFIEQGALRGITVRPLDPSLRERLGIPPNTSGVVVDSIQPGVPASRVLQPGDIIEEIGRRPITSPDDFRQVAAALDPNERVMIFLSRNRVRSFAIIDPS